MASAADIGANFSNYQGNSNLGGGSFGVVEINTKPIQDLARYTLLYNQAEYNQRQKDAEKWAEELAANTAYDLANSIPKYSKQIQDKYKEFTEYVAANPTARSYRDNPKLYLEYKKKQNEFENLLKAGKKQEVLTKVWDAAIAAETNVAEKERMRKLHEEDIASKDIFTPLNAIQKYDLKADAIPDPSQKKIEIGKMGANNIFTREASILDMGYVKAQSVLLGQEFDAADMGLDSEEFKKTLEGKTEEEKRLLIDEKKAKGNTNATRNLYLKMRDRVNDALKDESLYTDGVLDMDKLRKSKSLGDFVGLVDQINDYRKKMVEAIDSGAYTDNLGKKINFDGKRLNRNDYEPINITDGLKGTEFIEIQMQAKYKGDSDSLKSVQTNDDLEQQRINNERYGLQTERIKATKPTGKDDSTSITIEKPLLYLEDHINRIKGIFSKIKGDTYSVDYGAIDDKTRLATKVPVDGRIVYRRDGSYVVLDANKKPLSTNTIQNLYQGYMEAVINSDIDPEANKDGKLGKDWLLSGEATIRNKYGTSDIGKLFNNWDEYQKLINKQQQKLDENGLEP